MPLKGMQNELFHTLIIKSLTEGLTVKEEALLSEWILKSSENEAYYNNTIRSWELSLGAKPEYTPNTDKLWMDLLVKIKLEPRTGRVLSLFRGSSFFKIAASIVLIIGLGYLFSDKLLNDTIVKQTADGMELFYLPDSTVVWLNDYSKIEYSEEFNGCERIVYLDGEAFFDVTKDANSPFIIHAAGTITKVLGTSFNVKAYRKDNDVKVSVSTGKVSFSKDNETIMLLPEESGVYRKNTKALVLQHKANQVKEVEWKNNENVKSHSDVFAIETKNPLAYLHNSYGFRSNLISQTVIEGNIENNAKVCSYANIYMKAIYVSSKKKLYEHHFVIPSIVKPGQRIEYKEKLPDWFIGTNEVRLTVEKVQEVKF